MRTKLNKLNYKSYFLVRNFIMICFSHTKSIEKYSYIYKIFIPSAMGMHKSDKIHNYTGDEQFNKKKT